MIPIDTMLPIVLFFIASNDFKDSDGSNNVPMIPVVPVFIIQIFSF